MLRTMLIKHYLTYDMEMCINMQIVLERVDSVFHTWIVVEDVRNNTDFVSEVANL